MFSLRNMRAGALCDEKELKGMIIVMLSPYKKCALSFIIVILLYFRRSMIR